MWCAVDHILKQCECHCVICMCLLVCVMMYFYFCVLVCINVGVVQAHCFVCVCVCAADVKQASCGTMFRLDLQHLDSSPHELSHCQSLPLAY